MIQDDVFELFSMEIEKCTASFRSELGKLRTGRANVAILDNVKVDYYGSPTDLRQLALISVPEPTQIIIKPFDVSSTQAITKAIQASGLWLNPSTDGKVIRLILPPLSGERRNQLTGSVKQMGEQAKVTVRNSRREANRQVDQAVKDKPLHISEDAAEEAKHENQELLKKYEGQVDKLIAAKTKEIQEA